MEILNIESDVHKFLGHFFFLNSYSSMDQLDIYLKQPATGIMKDTISKQWAIVNVTAYELVSDFEGMNYKIIRFTINMMVSFQIIIINLMLMNYQYFQKNNFYKFLAYWRNQSHIFIKTGPN